MAATTRPIAYCNTLIIVTQVSFPERKRDSSFVNDAIFGNLWCPCEMNTREQVCEHVVAVFPSLRSTLCSKSGESAQGGARKTPLDWEGDMAHAA